MINRRNFLQAGALAAAGTTLAGCTTAEASNPVEEPKKKIRHNPIGVSTYSFWQFNKPKGEPPLEDIIDHVAAMGFDGVDILHVQMSDDSNSYLQNLKRRALINGLDLCAMSIHR